jgi:hypothetical protein
MMKFIRIAIPRFCIQSPPKIEDVEKSMMYLYVRMIQKYLNERNNIPSGNLIEVRYEDFITNPLQKIQDIYTKLQLDGFAKVKPAFQAYLASQKTTKIDQYSLNETVRSKVEKTWGFALREFGY